MAAVTSDIEDLCSTEKERIAIIDPNRCRPSKCGKECVKICPVNRQGKKCVEILASDDDHTRKEKIARIAETLCNGCGMCVKVCPFDAIKIVNVPKGLVRDIVHRYGENSFRLHKLPVIKKGVVTGILGQNGLGKSTIMSIFARELKMNLGRYGTPADQIDADVSTRFRGTDIQRIISGETSSVLKPQNLSKYRTDQTVGEFLADTDMDSGLGVGIKKLIDRQMKDISGGELQRVIIHHICSQDATMYMFDEPTSFLDLKQRLDAANSIRKLMNSDTYTVVIDHDVNILDYVSDMIAILYGERSIYGICATPLPSGRGINSYFDGYLPADNVRFRKTSFKFESLTEEEMPYDMSAGPSMEYDTVEVTKGSFKLNIEGAKFHNHGITILLGENGAGKTTFVETIAEIIDPNIRISSKTQNPNEELRRCRSQPVKEYLGERIYVDPFRDIVRKLGVDQIEDNLIKTLSGGELQKVMILKCIITDADVYLLDEPSAFLDTETRIIVSKVIKDYFFEKPVNVFIVEHDMLMATYLGEHAILFTGEVGQNMIAHPPTSMREGMNNYLMNLGITMRIDHTRRRRLNKLNSAKDREQKIAGEYY